MKKIGIITLNGYFNYGNRLQNFALQETLKKLGYDVETIWVEQTDELINKKKQNKIKKVVKVPKLIYNKLYKKLITDPLNDKRYERFRSFSNKYIKETPYKISTDYLPIELENFDYFVVGSDQVWNPYYTTASSIYFLTFTEKHKRVSYAPSFGVSEIPTEHKEDYTKWLNEMQGLSVREQAGADIIKDLTNKNATVVPDPTLLIDKDSWLTIATPAKNKPVENYLLTYFLGEISIDVKNKIKQYAKELNLTIINLAQIKDKDYYLTDPAEFLDYINSAELFVTDSFHGTVFSIMFGTPFIVTDRLSKIPSMNSRIQTLLSTYDLKERHISLINESNLLNVSFQQINEILIEERKKANDYLKSVLK